MFENKFDLMLALSLGLSAGNHKMAHISSETEIKE